MYIVHVFKNVGGASGWEGEKGPQDGEGWGPQDGEGEEGPQDGEREGPVVTTGFLDMFQTSYCKPPCLETYTLMLFLTVCTFIMSGDVSRVYI